MPVKVKELKANLARAGFTWRSGKGSHTVWKHPALLGVRVTISGKDGNDAEPYQIDQVRKALNRLK